jgi:hypothetical protein
VRIWPILKLKRLTIVHLNFLAKCTAVRANDKAADGKDEMLTKGSRARAEDRVTPEGTRLPALKSLH